MIGSSSVRSEGQIRITASTRYPPAKDLSAIIKTGKALSGNSGSVAVAFIAGGCRTQREEQGPPGIRMMSLGLHSAAQFEKWVGLLKADPFRVIGGAFNPRPSAEICGVPSLLSF